RELHTIIGAPYEQIDGHVVYPWFDNYWEGPARVPFAIYVGASLVGFCLLRDTGTDWEIAEFYVIPECRRRGVGTFAVSDAKEFCRTRGAYSTVTAGISPRNPRTIQFWQSQGFKVVGFEDGRLIGECAL